MNNTCPFCSVTGQIVNGPLCERHTHNPFHGTKEDFHQEFLGMPPRPTQHAAQPADRVTDNTMEFKRRWKRVDSATNFTEA